MSKFAILQPSCVRLAGKRFNSAAFRGSGFAGRTPLQAAIEASRLRLRPILMTSMAFVMGVLPLVLATGAGAEMRHAMGVAGFQLSYFAAVGASGRR